MLIDKILRHRILESNYWKQNCYSINVADLCVYAAELKAVGGLHTNQKPTPFLCLLYKLGLIAPGAEIIEELLGQPYFKYITVLAAVYIRLVYPARSIYELLEPLRADYRKIRIISQEGTEELWHVDEIIHALLTRERFLNLSLPRLPSRPVLEERGLPPRKELVEVDFSN